MITIYLIISSVVSLGIMMLMGYTCKKDNDNPSVETFVGLVAISVLIGAIWVVALPLSAFAVLCYICFRFAGGEID